MKILGAVMVAIGLWYGLAFLMGLVIDPTVARDPLTTSELVDGMIFLVLGAGLLAVCWQRSRAKQEPAEEQIPPIS